MTSLSGLFTKYGLQSSHLPQMQLLPEVAIIMSMNYQSISNGEEKAYHLIWYTQPTTVFIAHVCEIVPKQWRSATRSIYACRACLQRHQKLHCSLLIKNFQGSGLRPQLIIYNHLLPPYPLHSTGKWWNEYNMRLSPYGNYRCENEKGENHTHNALCFDFSGVKSGQPR